MEGRDEIINVTLVDGLLWMGANMWLLSYFFPKLIASSPREGFDNKNPSSTIRGTNLLMDFFKDLLA